MNKNNRLPWIIAAVSLVSALIALITALVIRQRKIAQRKTTVSSPSFTPVHIDIDGLSQEEVDARKQDGLSNAIEFKPRRTIKEIIRYNTFSIFNISLLGIAFVQLLLGKPLDALLSIGVMLLNVGLNTAQELIAKRRLEDIEKSNNPKATVIRESRVHSISPDDIVIGDVVVIGPGDRLYVDGKIFGDNPIRVDESFITGESKREIKSQDDLILAGSYCVSGHSIYKATRVGTDRRLNELIQSQSNKKEDLTPIERIIDRVLKVMLIFVFLFTAILLIRYFRLEISVDVETIIDAVSVIFSLAPAGLFFMILLTYMAGTADLAKIGALVHQARSVELMAQVNVMCFSQSGVLTGTRVNLEYPDQGDIEDHLPETRIRQVLGDFSRSLSYNNMVLRGIRRSFEGNKRPIVEEAPFMSIFGWSGIVLNNPDLQGVFILGDERILQDSLKIKNEQKQIEEESAEKESFLRNTFGRIGGVFKRSDSDEEAKQPYGGTVQQQPTLADDQETHEDDEGRQKSGNTLQRFWGRIKRALPGNSDGDPETPAEPDIEKKASFIFAYTPRIQSIQDDNGEQTLPDDLIPLCIIELFEQVRRDSIDTLQQIADEGVKVKIFSVQPPEETAEKLISAGWTEAADEPISMINGNELAVMDEEEFSKAAVENQIFGGLTPIQNAKIIHSLREQGQYVSVIGDGIKDIPALQKADLAIALQSSNQVARSISDIILLDDSPGVLSSVFTKGQRIVNGLMDVLKLYLTQILYLFLMIILVQSIAYGFPYKSAQGGLIAFLTLTIPSLGLSLWASSGAMANRNLNRVLAYFIIPAAVTIAATAVFIYDTFLGEYGVIDYAQLAVTYTLVGIGLMLALMIKPPLKLIRGSLKVNSDQRFTFLIFAGYMIFILLVSIPLAQELLKIGPLQSSSDYLLITVTIIVWGLALTLIWKIWNYFADRVGWFYKKPHPR